MKIGKYRLYSADPGNDHFKAVVTNSFDSAKENWELITFPNAISEVESFPPTDSDSSSGILEDLQVKIESEALNKKIGKYLVGEAATEDKYKDEFIEGRMKWDTDNSIVNILCGAAVDAIESGEFEENGEVINAVYALSTGLPVSEYKTESHRTAFKERFLKGTHKVTFAGSNKKISGKQVVIKFIRVLVSNEADSAHIFLKELEGIKEYTNDTYIHSSLGGGTMEISPIVKNKEGKMKADLRKAVSENLGMSPAIDQVMETIKSKDGYNFKSRQHFISVALSDTPYQTETASGFIDATEEARNEFLPLAKTVVRKLDNVLNVVSDAKAIVISGGAPALLKPFIEEVNDRKRKIFFIENPITSRMLLAYSYLKKLQLIEKVIAQKDQMKAGL